MYEHDEERWFDYYEVLAWVSSNIMRSNGMKAKPEKLFNRKKASVRHDKIDVDELQELGQKLYGGGER